MEGHFLGQADRQDQQQRLHLGRQIELFSDDRDLHVDAARDPDLRLHGVIRGAVKLFDAQMQFDPLGEELDLPATIVEHADGQGRRQGVVGQEYQAYAGVEIAIADATQVRGIVLRRSKVLERFQCFLRPGDFLFRRAALQV
jgi:hypothetical protein